MSEKINTIEITVTGHSGTGKSTVAEMIFELLGKEGFVETIHVPMEILAAERYTEERTAARRDAVRQKTRIVIREKQARRTESLEPEEHFDRDGGILHGED